jgi:hypothetical protein
MRNARRWTTSEMRYNHITPGKTASNLNQARLSKKQIPARNNLVIDLNVQYLLLQIETFILMTLLGNKNLQ